MSSTFGSLLVLFAASIALVKGVDIFINSVSQLAHRFKISGYTISFLLVAIGTSLPEAVIAITSGIEKNPILSFGDAMGSNMALLTLVIAIPAIFGSGISTRAALHSRDLYFTALFAGLPLAFSLDGTLSRLDGTFLLLAYAIYMYFVVKRAQGIEKIKDTLEHTDLYRNIILFIISLGILLGASHLIVTAAITFSIKLGIELGLVGLTITAIGTSLPEIAFSIGAINHNKKEEIIGDIIGSVVANSSLVLGLASTIYPIQISNSKIGPTSIFAMILFTLIFLKFSRSKEKIDTFEGILLVIFYIIFVIVEYMIAL